MSSPPSHSPPEIPKLLVTSDPASNNNSPPLMKLNLGELSLTSPSSPGRVKSGILDSNILGVEIGKTTNWTIEKNLEVCQNRYLMIQSLLNEGTGFVD